MDIVALGEPLVEFVRTDLPEAGIHYRMGFGGDTSNAVIAAARQGARVGYISAVGTDEFGDELMALWAREGVDASRVVRRENAATGIYFVRPHASGRQFSYLRAHSAASRFQPEDLDAGYISNASVLHVSAISQAVSRSMRDAGFEAIRIARANNVLVSFDTNLRLKLWSLEDAKMAIFEAMRTTDIVFPSDDEAALLTGLKGADDIVDRFLALGVRIVALKRGAHGAIIATRNRRETVAPMPVQAVDSTGAGDAFAGSFLAYYCETGDPFEAGRRAAQVAAGTVTGLGAIDPIPRRGQIRFGPS